LWSAPSRNVQPAFMMAVLAVRTLARTSLSAAVREPDLVPARRGDLWRASAVRRALSSIAGLWLAAVVLVVIVLALWEPGRLVSLPQEDRLLWAAVATHWPAQALDTKQSPHKRASARKGDCSPSRHRQRLLVALNPSRTC
jgi:hypothetical protein